MGNTKKVFLFCSAGMSTSMLAYAMLQVADNHKLPITVEAKPVDSIGQIIEAEHPDCILLGPQVSHMYNETVKRYGPTGIPISLIDKESYGLMDGEKVLKKAVLLIKQAKAGK